MDIFYEDTLFTDSAQVGEANCLCSRCGKVILTGIPIYGFIENAHYFYRFHPQCFGLEVIEDDEKIEELPNETEEENSPTVEVLVDNLLEKLQREDQAPLLPHWKQETTGKMKTIVQKLCMPGEEQFSEEELIHLRWYIQLWISYPLFNISDDNQQVFLEKLNIATDREAFWEILNQLNDMYAVDPL